MNPELKTVPVDQAALRAKLTKVWNDAYASPDPISTEEILDRLTEAAASPPQPVAGDEGAEPDFDEFRATQCEACEGVGCAICQGEELPPDVEDAPPPPPADLKAEAASIIEDIDTDWTYDGQSIDDGRGAKAEAVKAITAFAERIRSAAHAAGKAEALAQWMEQGVLNVAAGKAEGQAATDLTGSEIISDLRNRLATAQAEMQAQPIAWPAGIEVKASQLAHTKMSDDDRERAILETLAAGKAEVGAERAALHEAQEARDAVGFLGSVAECIRYLDSSAAAAHAAGKAEGQVDRERLEAKVSDLTASWKLERISRFHADLIAANRRADEAVGALRTARAEALEEAKKEVAGKVHARLAVAVSKEGRTDHIGTYNHGMAEAFREVLAMVALISAPPPEHREEAHG